MPRTKKTAKAATASSAVEALIAKIAAEHLDIETLETRSGDQLDFHNVSVWGLRAALEAAFEAGRKSA